MVEGLKEALSRRRRKTLDNEGFSKAAVLIPIFKKDGEYHIVFTKRTDKVQHHKGQVSFPGGAYEAGNGDLLTTALRECEEEIGLKPSDVIILGALDDVKTLSSRYIITPFVALIPYPYEFKANTHEVAKVFAVPLSELLDERNFKGDRWVYDGEEIWGATAAILKQLLELLGEGEWVRKKN
ncbi:MAG TPA: CoA pyrophosphatase [Methanomicrobia archaeon]|mgnify:CR=1 FL=1|nr:CoA pyrophosphatase [Methanomicrobia archaeon]HEX59051.1 CoA pyrophosphatase [Methanomicrobia archaeon]